MRISYVLDTFDCGGKERRCLQIIQGLNRSGYTDIQVVIINNNVAFQELFDTTARIEILDRKNKGLSQLQTAKTLYSLLKSFDSDIVQAWGLMSAGIVLMVKPFLNFVFLASYVADVMPPKGVNSIINRFCFRFCSKIISNSEAGIKAYHIPRQKAIVIYNGINECRLAKIVDKERKKNELQISTPYVVAMVATFWKGKDWKCFLQTAKSIIMARKDITFLAVGSGPSWEEYNNMILDEERSLIKMMGKRDDVDELFQICDISVLLSTCGEGVSNSIVESMSFGVPVIATNSGGTPEIIDDRINGILLKQNDSKELKDCILMLIEDHNLRNKLSLNAVNTINDYFLLEKKIHQYIDLYKSYIVDDAN